MNRTRLENNPPPNSFTSQPFWAGKLVVVPGGAGFIGSSVVDALFAAGARVRAIDNLSSGSWQRLAPHDGRVERVEEDLTNCDLPRHFHGAHAVINMAGLAPGLMPGEERHAVLYQENLRIADAVLAATLAASVPRLVVVSSSCVYPDDAPVPTPELDLTDSMPETVNRGYGMAKREIELRAPRAAGGPTAITIARPFNACGPRDQATGPGAHVIPALLSRILDPDCREITVWGSGRQTRSFIDARDVATALLLLAEHHPHPDPVNIGSGEEITLQDLVRQLLELTGIEKPVRFDPTKPEGALRKGCDPSKLISITGFRPRYRLADSLADIVAARRGSSAGNEGLPIQGLQFSTDIH